MIEEEAATTRLIVLVDSFAERVGRPDQQTVAELPVEGGLQRVILGIGESVG